MTVTSIRKNLPHRFNDHQIAELAKRAITPEQAADYGVLGVQVEADLPEGAPTYWTVKGGYLPGMLFPWTSTSGGSETTWQIKPDIPRPDPLKPGEFDKYLFAKGWKPVLHPVRVVPGSDKVLIVEGTHQRIAAGIYAPDGWSVYGIAGCRGWSTEGLPINDLEEACDGATVTVVFDADMTGNINVYEAGQALACELDMAGASSVRFALVGGGKNTGIDDILGGKEKIESRYAYFSRLLDPSRCPEPSKVKKPSRDAIRAAERAKKEEARKLAAEIDQRRAAKENRALVDVSGDRHLVTCDVVNSLKSRWDGENLFRRGTPATLYFRSENALNPVDRDGIRNLIAFAMRTGSQNKITGEWQDSWPDDGTLGTVLTRARQFKPIEVVTNSPFVRVDGSICMTNGYDPASRIYVRMDEKLALDLDVPDEPTEEDVRAAVKFLLDDWLVDFPFAEQCDRASALALILTPFVRQFMDVVPIAVLDGNGPSAGKGLLADLFSRLVLGRPAALKAMPSDDEEMRKSITAALEAGRHLIMWDETHSVEGKYLAQLLTAPTWVDRRLGSTTEVEVENRAVFAALGNNVRVEGDLGRRAYRIRIHPKMERPEDRDVNTFRHPDIKGWTDEHRAELLSAVLVLIRSWHCAGRPSGRADMGSFERWTRTVGGILANAGVPGFLDGRKEWLDGANTSTDTWASHLAWLFRTFGKRTFKTSDAATELARAGLDAPLPSHVRALAAPEATAAYSQSLGQVYRHRKDQTFYGLTLVREGSTDGASRWAVWAEESDAPGDSGASVTYSYDKSDTEASEKGSKGSKVDGDLRTNATPHQENFLRRAPLKGGGAFPGSPLAPLPVTSAAADPRNDRAPLIEAILARHADPYESRCPDCKTVEVLVDDLWHSCPSCHPATVAANDRTAS